VLAEEDIEYFGDNEALILVDGDITVEILTLPEDDKEYIGVTDLLSLTEDEYDVDLE
jgi:hypothetical protein